MVPLYAARVQDLGPDDVAVFKCGACGHTAELWPSFLIGGLGLQPTDKVLDLERRLRCRLCYARNQAVVTIKYLDCQPGTDRRRHYGASRFCRGATVLGRNSGTCIMLAAF